MKLFVVLCLVSVALAAPERSARQANYQDIQLIRSHSDNDGLGTWSYGYEQSNGQKEEVQGELRNAGTDDESIYVKGSYTWVGPDGVTYVVTYVADDNGYQPTIEQGPGGAVPGHIASLLG